MVQYRNPGGHDWAKPNTDGYGISLLVFILAYTVVFLIACAYLWAHRNHPVIRMRKINLALMSILVLHIYLIMIFLVYPLNGSFPCGLEFWVMSLHLPIGIGLFQAQNQQLLVVSNDQHRLIHADEAYKPLAAVPARGIGTPQYWAFRFQLWWNRVSKQGRYEACVFLGIVVQFVGSMTIYCISKQFNRYGIVGNPVSPGVCRQGWECLPGTPLWLAGTYTNSGFAPINKYWVPPLWFAPGLITMELTTLIFPIFQIQKHKQACRETTRALADFDAKRLKTSDDSTTVTSGSMATRSTGSKGKMYSMESLDECLQNDHDGLQVYASCMELNGENIVFLVKVLKFKQLWLRTFSSSNDFLRARTTMFRAALSIYVSLVHSRTANYPINIESTVYSKLESIFGHATRLVAYRRQGNSVSTPISQVTPWEEPAEPTKANGPENLPMRVMMSTTPNRTSVDNESREQIFSSDDSSISYDPLAGYAVPAEFDAHAFDAAFKSVRYMVWTETWQRYLNWKKSSGAED